MKLKEILGPRNIRLKVQVEDWRQAIRACGEILVRTECAEEKYIDAMIEVAEEFGPYIVIAPGLALPHARPKDGCYKESVAAITLKDPINFGNEANDPVKVVIALGVVDNKQHISLISELATYLQKEHIVEHLYKAKSKNKFLDILFSTE